MRTTFINQVTTQCLPRNLADNGGSNPSGGACLVLRTVFSKQLTAQYLTHSPTDMGSNSAGNESLVQRTAFSQLFTA